MVLTIIALCAGFLIGSFCGIKLTWKALSDFILTWKELSDKHLMLFEASIKWIQLKQRNKKISDYLVNIGCEKIGIYGMGNLGERLYDELKDSHLNIIYGIDKNAKDIKFKELLIIFPDEIDCRVDTIVVTSIASYENIRINLLKKIDKNIRILSLETILLAS